MVLWTIKLLNNQGSKICPNACHDGIWQSGCTAPLIPNLYRVSLAALPPATDPSVPTEYEASGPQHQCEFSGQERVYLLSFQESTKILCLSSLCLVTFRFDTFPEYPNENCVQLH
jgi:hypothetical protein